MKDYWILKVLDKLKGFFSHMGVDYPVMRNILQLKLLMDGRKAPGVLMNNTKKPKENTYIKSLITYALTGLFSAIFIFLPFPLFLKMNMVYGVVLFMLMATMVSDFSSILLDVKDKTILLSKPIDAKTINGAKIVHIVLNMLPVTIATSAPAMLAGLYIHGLWFFMLMFFQLLLIAGFILFTTSFLYFFILTFFDGDKLRDIINYFQIVLSLIIMVSYQFIGHISRIVGTHAVVVLHWWVYLLPSAWFAAPFSLLLEHNWAPTYIILSIVGVVLPIILLTAYFKVAITYFEKKLYKLDMTGTRKKRNRENRGTLNKWMIDILCPNPLERAFFRFTQNMISSERDLKLRLYPNLGFAVFLPVIMMINNIITADSMQEALSSISGGHYYFAVYLTIFSLATTIATISSSEKYKGAWIYKALPVPSPSSIVKGALKGFVLKYLIPVYLFECLLFIIPYGISIIPDLVLILLNMLLLIVGIFRFTPKVLPFYKPLQLQHKENGGFGVVFGSLGFCGGAAALHYALKAIPFAIAIYMILVVIAIVVLWRKDKKITWSNVA